MKFRIAEELWDGRRPEREREWQHALLDLNAEHDGLPPTLTIARRADGGADITVSEGDDAKVVTLTFDMMRDHFREYRDVIARLARADAGSLGMRDWETLDMAKKLVHDEAGGKIRRAWRGVFGNTDRLDLKLARRVFTIVFLVAADIPAELVTRHRRHGPPS